MQQFYRADEFFTVMAERVTKVKAVDIATYGAYLGFSKGEDWHKIYPLPARTFLEKCPSGSTRLLIGQATFAPRDCRECMVYLDAVKNRHDSLIRAVQFLTGVTIRQRADCHFKYYRIGKAVFFGGINVGSSKADDILLLASWEQGKILNEHFEHLWKGAL